MGVRAQVVPGESPRGRAIVRGRSTGMTSVRITPIARSPVETGIGHREHPRLTLKPRALATGAVDGGWWPRSRNLAAEVPALLSVLADRLGTVEGVSYNPDDWGPPPSKIIA